MVEIDRSLWPCIDDAGLQVFATTADERYLLGQDLFLATHFPITLRRYVSDYPTATVGEADLLSWLMRSPEIQVGNRVFVLYGAAGSGKSELMRWLQLQLTQNAPSRTEFVVRIPRTELDVLRIAERFHHTLSQNYFDETTYRRWAEAQQKPRTLTKLLLLTALERCLDSDEQINALYYRLLAWIQPRIARSLSLVDQSNGASDEQVEIITREDLEQLREETALPVPLDYEQFRFNLLRAFREHLLEGISLPETLRLIAEDVNRKGTRPILLIDDLVQSVNLFATDLLDYFITLDSGNWDVVLGLTPSALANNARGRELLDRITYLDTVDDRVEKLWLSDVQGHDSYFLTQENCEDFAALYLNAFRARNQWACETCPHQARCSGMDNGQAPILAPFNRAVLRRLFQSLPGNKGKARQFVRRLREVLAALAGGEDLLAALAQHSQLDTAAEADDVSLARLAELYGPPATNERRLTLSAELMAAFGLEAETVTLPAEPLKRKKVYSGQPYILLEKQPDPTKEAIKAWLDGEIVNRQSLLGLRRGIARWLRSVYPVDGIHAHAVARPHNVLRWRKVYLSVRPPIIFEGVDEDEGILVKREIGLAAFRLYDYTTAVGDETKALIVSLAEEERLLPILFAVADYQQHIAAQLETQLGISLYELAIGLFVWHVLVGGLPDTRPPGIDDRYWKQLETRHRQPYDPNLRSRAMQLSSPVWYLFEDFFKLRENVYDGPKIAALLNDRNPDTLLDLLMKIDPAQLDSDYRLDKKPLANTLSTVQEITRFWREAETTEANLSPTAQTILERLLIDDEQGVLLSQISPAVWQELQTMKPDVFATLRVKLER